MRTTAAEVIPRRATVRSDTPDPDPGHNISGEEPAAAAAREEPAAAPEEPAPEEGCLDDPEQAQNALEEAQRLYRLELFIEAVQLLAPCVPLLDKPLKIEALRLMAIAHYESGEPDSSRQWVRQLVRRVDRGYRVDLAEDPLFFQDLVRQLRPKWYQKRWVQVSGGVVLGVVLGYVLFRPEVRPPGPLAGPPVFPPPSQ